MTDATAGPRAASAGAIPTQRQQLSPGCLVRGRPRAYTWIMADSGRVPNVRANAEHLAFRVHPEDEAELRAANADIDAGRIVDLTPEELAEWEATGELPASVVARLSALGCHDSQD